MADGTAQLWWVGPDACGAEHLDAAERARMGRFEQAALAQRFGRARSALRVLLGALLGLAPAAVPLISNARGQVLLDPVRAPANALSFSVSHCAQGSLLGVAQGQTIGIDIAHAGGLASVAGLAAWLDPACGRRIADLPEAAARHCFFNWWTALEALGKASGGGLPVVLPEAAAMFAPAQASAARVAFAQRRWSLLRVTPSFTNPSLTAAFVTDADTVSAPSVRLFSN